MWVIIEKNIEFQDNLFRQCFRGEIQNRLKVHAFLRNEANWLAKILIKKKFHFSENFVFFTGVRGSTMIYNNTPEKIISFIETMTFNI